MLACNREFYPLLSIVAVSFEAQVKTYGALCILCLDVGSACH